MRDRRSRPTFGAAPGEASGRYAIGVAARLAGMHPQTLRKYEREGFLRPGRTTGNIRLYSDADLGRLRTVRYLVEERGLNLAGVEMAIELGGRLRELTSRLAQRQADDLVGELEDLLVSIGQRDQ